MTGRAPTVRDLVARLGPHPASGHGLDLSKPGGRGRWWVAALVLGSGASEEAALRAVGHLARSGLAAPEALAAVEADRLAPLLGEIGRNRLGPLAARLVRSSRALGAGGGGEPGAALEASAALDAIAARSAGLEELGMRLARPPRSFTGKFHLISGIVCPDSRVTAACRQSGKYYQNSK